MKTPENRGIARTTARAAAGSTAPLRRDFSFPASLRYPIIATQAAGTRSARWICKHTHSHAGANAVAAILARLCAGFLNCTDPPEWRVAWPRIHS